jgi:hypothetical protein
MPKQRQTTITSTVDDFKEEIAMLRTNIAKTQEIMQTQNHDDLENKIKIGTESQGWIWRCGFLCCCFIFQ